jgi:4-hydroxy-2-oxoglutarate aldolase
MKLQGIFIDTTTPFDHNGTVYKVKVQHNLEKWNRTTVAGYVICGSTGEGVLLSSDEKSALWEMAAQYAAPEKLLIAGAIAEGVQETAALANRAAGLGLKAALIEAPRYYADFQRPDAQLLYFRTVADRVRVPLIAAGISSDLVAPLSQHPNIIAACVNTSDAGSLLRGVRPGFQVLAASARTLWTALQSGACGAILGFAAAAPFAAIVIWEAHRTREEEAGVDWQQRITPAAEIIDECYGVPGLKHAMELNAYYGGPPRLPLTVPSLAARSEIEQAFLELRTDR